ncbi:hypothetical protein Bca4012_084520 [Brassica carinata]
MKACVILMLVICADVIMEQSEAIENNPVYKCLQKNPTNNKCVIEKGGTPRAANEYRRGCSKQHRCRGGR